MNPDQSSWDESRLDNYLDEQMDGDEAADYEQSMKTDEGWQQKVGLQRRIDESLRAHLTPPSLASERFRSVAAAAQKASSDPGSSAAWWKWIAAAALLGIAAWLLIANWSSWNGSANRPYYSQSMTEIYEASVKLGFHPKWLCEDDREFAMTFQERQGQAMLLKPMPDGMRMVGLAYLGGLSEDSTTLMCIVDGIPIMVFVDRQGQDVDDRRVRPSDRINIFRSESNGLVFYEVTPLEQPVVTEFLYPVDEIPPVSRQP